MRYGNLDCESDSTSKARVDLSLHKAIHYESKKGYETLSEDWMGNAVCADSFGFGLRVFYQRLRIKRYNLFNKLSSEKDV